MRKKLRFMISMFLLVIVGIGYTSTEVGATESRSTSEKAHMIISNETLDAQAYISTGDFDLQKSQQNIIGDEELPLEAYRIDQNLHFNPEEETASLYNLSKNERKIPLEVGATKNFWVVDFRTDEDVSIKAKLLYKGTKSEVWVHNQEITANQAKQMGQEFDKKIYPIVTKNFAKESDVDGNGRISILVYDIQDGFEEAGGGSYTGGYFYSRDLYDVRYSNQSEIFYIDTYPTMGLDKSNYDVSEAYSTLAHEFQHLVNYNRNVLVEDGEPMETWLDESMAMAAEHMYLGDVLRSRLYFYESSHSIANGHSLLYWDHYNDPLANYSLSYLFGQYLRVQLNQGDKIFKEIIDQKLPTNEAVQAVLNKNLKGKKLEEFITDFRQALLLNEKEGLYGFKGESERFSMNPQLYNGKLPTQLRGGGSIIVPIDEAFKFVRPNNAGKSIQYRLIGLDDSKVVYPKQPVVLPINHTEEKVRGTAEKNSLITVYKDKQELGTTYADEKGDFEVLVQRQPKGTKLFITVTNEAGHTSVAKPIIVIDGTIKAATTSLLGHIKSRKAFVYATPSDQVNRKTAIDHVNRVYYIKKQATYADEIYYLLSTQSNAEKGVIGWMKAKDITSQPHSGIDRKEKLFYVKGTGGVGYDTAWGGSKNQVFADLKSYKNNLFTVNLTEKVGKSIWYRGTLAGKETWIHSNHVAEFNDAYREQSVSLLGHINPGKSSIYTTPYNQSQGKSSEPFKNSVYYIKKQAMLNGQKYYLLSNSPSASKNVVGWMKASDVSSQAHVGIDKRRKTFLIKGSGSGYTRAWGGRQNFVYANLQAHQGQTFTVNLTEKVGKSIWYRGTLAGKETWIHSDHVAALSDAYREQTISLLGHINPGKSSIYTTFYDQKQAKSSEPFKNSVYYIKKQATLNDQKYYLLSNSPSATKNTVGWMKASDVSSQAHVGIDKRKKTFLIKGTGSGYTRAWGGRQNFVYANLQSYKNQIFTVNLTEKVGKSIWYRGTLAGKETWIHSNHVVSLSDAYREQTVSLLGHINPGKSSIYTMPYDQHQAKSSEPFKNSVYYIKKQATLNGERYYLLSNSPSASKNVVGWMKASDVSSQAHVGIDKRRKTFLIKGSGSGYTRAWGGRQNFVYANLQAHQGQTFTVNLTEKVGNSTWYRGKLAGKETWIHSNHVVEFNDAYREQSVSLLGHINPGKSSIYTTPYDQKQGKSSEPFKNSVYYIKKQATLNGEKYYLLSNSPSASKNTVGWMKASDISSQAHVGLDKRKKTFLIKGSGSGYTRAWGGRQNFVYSNLQAYQGQTFTVNLTERVGNSIWYRGRLAGKETWIHSDYVRNPS